MTAKFITLRERLQWLICEHWNTPRTRLVTGFEREGHIREVYGPSIGPICRELLERASDPMEVNDPHPSLAAVKEWLRVSCGPSIHELISAFMLGGEMPMIHATLNTDAHRAEFDEMIVEAEPELRSVFFPDDDAPSLMERFVQNCHN